METALEFTADDVAYIEENFICLQTRAPRGPAASYVLEDGSEFYPPDYFEQEMDEARFKERLRSEMDAQRISLDPDETWQTYMEGIYGVCLQSATPENIVRKAAMLARVEQLTQTPDRGDSHWVRALKHAVDMLDKLERPFSPHYDRARFGRPPTRDTHIRNVRRRYPEIT